MRGGAGATLPRVNPRFLTLADVAEQLNISAAQAYALVRNREIRAIKVGGRGQYRIEAAELERFISQAYEDTDRFLDEHPFTKVGDEPDD